MVRLTRSSPAARRTLSAILLLTGLLVASALTGAAAGESLAIGQPMLPFPEPPLAAEDQHGAAFTLTGGTRTLLLAFDMDTAKAANQQLATHDAAFLDTRHAVYAVDIHGMPGIGRVFALPKMRKYPHRIILLDDPALVEGMPAQTGRLTRVSLDAEAVITGIDFIDASSPAEDWFAASGSE